MNQTVTALVKNVTSNSQTINTLLFTDVTILLLYIFLLFYKIRNIVYKYINISKLSL